MYYCSSETNSWASINDLYERFGDEYVDKLATRRKWDAALDTYVADESVEGRTRVLTLALCDAKALLIQKISCLFGNISLLSTSNFSSIRQWHIRMAIEVLKAGGDCHSCNCESLDNFLKCGTICDENGVCLPSKTTFISVSEAKFPCECEDRCSCC